MIYLLETQNWLGWALGALISAVESIANYITSNVELLVAFVETIPQYLGIYMSMITVIPVALLIPLTIVLLIQVAKAILYGG